MEQTPTYEELKAIAVSLASVLRMIEVIQEKGVDVEEELQGWQQALIPPAVAFLYDSRVTAIINGSLHARDQITQLLNELGLTAADLTPESLDELIRMYV